jgi:hypothetical protein
LKDDTGSGLKNVRNPRLDLDSVFNPPMNRRIRESQSRAHFDHDDRASWVRQHLPRLHNRIVFLLDRFNRTKGPLRRPALEIGCTVQEAGLPSYPNDLPRNEEGKAQIGDDRNDQLLPVAQLHQALIRFYNRTAEYLSEDNESVVRKTVLLHFQSVVLYDYLAKLICEKVFRSVMQKGRKKFLPNRIPANKQFFLPIEFAVAAFRFGHSMARDSYPSWNPVQLADLTQFWKFTHDGRDPASKPMKKLPSTWVANWLRLFDFSRIPYGGPSCEVLMANRIDTRLAPALASIPVHLISTPKAREVDLLGRDLPVRTLLRGARLQIADAQTIISDLNGVLDSEDRIEVLNEQQLLEGESAPIKAALVENEKELLKSTPLWFYVLKEADALAQGVRLGPLGSRLVMETIHGVLEHTSPSILTEPRWRATLPFKQGEIYTMAGLLAFTGGLNPIGDGA